MEEIKVNYWAVLSCGVIAMIIAPIWYGPLFGKKWLEILEATPEDLKKREEMEKKALPLYLLQFILTLFQALVLSHLIADTARATGLERSLWICAAFVIPTLTSTILWTNESGKVKLARFLIQGGYQLVLFIIFGIIIQYWK